MRRYEDMNRRSLVLAVLAAAMVSACTSAGYGGSSSTSPSHGSSASTSTSTGPPAQLTQSHPCAGIAGFICSTLRVPLDHSGHTPGTLRLQVAAADNVRSSRGVLLFLTGGPGQPGVPFVPRIANRIALALRDYRLVMFDQRGTGQFGTINCPALQAAVGSSDITVPSRRSVQDCANSIGPNRRFYSTADTVADMDMLRQALSVQKMVVDGVSYGTFVAEHYALAYPTHVSKLVLDSVLPTPTLAIPTPSTWSGFEPSVASYERRARPSRYAASTLHLMWPGWCVIEATACRFSTCWSPTNSSIRHTATRTLRRCPEVSAMWSGHCMPLDSGNPHTWTSSSRDSTKEAVRRMSSAPPCMPPPCAPTCDSPGDPTQSPYLSACPRSRRQPPS